MRIIQISLFVSLLMPQPMRAQSISAPARNQAVGALHAKAALRGESYERVDLQEPWARARDLKDLSADASVVVVVKVMSNRCELSKDEQSIYTRYKVRAAEVLGDDFRFRRENHPAQPHWPEANAGRSSISAGQEIEVTLAGGKIGFADHTSAQVDVLNVPRLLNGRRYLLYLHYSPSLRSFIVAHLSQGMFEVREDGSTLHWMAVEKTEKGYRLQAGPFADDLDVARQEAKIGLGK